MSILDDENNDIVTESFLNTHNFKDGCISWEDGFIRGKLRKLKICLDFDPGCCWLATFDVFYSPTKGLFIMYPDMVTYRMLLEFLRRKFRKCVTYSTSKSELLIMMSKDFIKSNLEKL